MPLGDQWIEHCQKYVYLGVIFTSDGSSSSSLQEHANDKQKHFNKLVIFLNTNEGMPFFAKRKVMEAAFNAAILYGCESWLDTGLNAMDKLYSRAVKCLLGVRITTANDLCYTELGVPSLKNYVKRKQYQFFSKMMSERQGMSDDPLCFALELTRTHNHKLYQYITNLSNSCEDFGKCDAALRGKIRNSQRTKFVTYRTINPNCVAHQVYSRDPHSMTLIPEYLRNAFTRMRLSSHRLRIETGRWARLPREHRLCRCGAIQDEQHVLQDCPLVQHIRDCYQKQVMYPDILQSTSEIQDFKYIHDIMTYYQWTMRMLFVYFLNVCHMQSIWHKV